MKFAMVMDACLGVHGGGHAWWGGGGVHAWHGACMAEGYAWQERWPLQRVVHILLECILVYDACAE